MSPEYPHWFEPGDAELLHVEGIDGEFGVEYDGMPCGMIRMGVRCGNEAYLVLSYDRPHNEPAFLAVCQTCSDERGGNATTSFWRKLQRAWGVR